MQVPHYDELSVRNIYPMFKKDPIFQSYFPDTYPVGKGPPRDYFMNVLNTLEHEYLQKCMGHANEQRLAAFGKGQEQETIQISQFWEQELKSMPYLTRKSCPVWTP